MNVFGGEQPGLHFLVRIDAEVNQIKAVFPSELVYPFIKAVAMLVLLPAPAKAAITPKKVPPELCDGRAVLEVGGQKQVSGVNTHCTNGLQVGKFVAECGAKGGTRNGKAAPVSSSIREPSTEAGDEDNAGYLPKITDEVV